MAETPVDLDTWPRAAQFRFFRTFERPQFSVTSRIDASRLVARRADGVSPYRASLFAIGAGLHGVAELRMRFRGDDVVLHDRVALSMTVPRPDGSFGYAYVPWMPDHSAFEARAKTIIDATAQQRDLAPNADRDDVAYLSCMPWLDYTAISNAMPGPDDCIPRVAWGRFTENGPDRFSMAMTLEVHHALADGVHVGAFFAAVQTAIDAI